jgi:hypothetical protein
MKPDAVARAERVLGARAERWTRVTGRGYANNERWLVAVDAGASVFVKTAVDEQGADWLRAEHRIYRGVRGDFLPELLGWIDDDAFPVLVLEDVSHGAFWPPPWSRDAVDAVLAALGEVAATAPPAGVRALEADRSNWVGWDVVADDPQPFLGLGLCSGEWLDAAGPALLAAARAARLDGSALVHCDVRSDNLCIRSGRAVLFDWNHARVGNATLDVAFWLPSLELEGGPRPEEVLRNEPGVPELAALVAGFFAARAGLPPPAGAPTVRGIQLAQLRPALAWACRALDLDPPST